MKKTILFIGLMSSAVFLAQGQDPRYTQTYSAPLRLNPALMGPNPDLKAILSYRGQWGNIQKGFTTYRFTFLFPWLMQDNGGKLDLGLSAYQDVAGAFTTLDINVAASYSLKISEKGHHLTGALTGGFIQKSLDNSGLTFNDQYVLGSYSAANPSKDNIVNEQVMNPDFGGGVLWNFSPEESKVNAFAGASVFHHNRANESFTGGEGDLPARYVVHGGVKIMTEGKFDFLPNIILNRQAGAEETAIGLYTGFNINENMKAVLGLWYRYRNQDAVAAEVGFEHKSFAVGYSYDMGSFQMNKVITGAMTHEITLAYKMNRAEKKGVQIKSMF